jgi:undecaprenyl diphosphate synthase
MERDADLRLPAHVAIIMDGNGRWAQARGKPRIFGHRRGVDAVRETVRAAGEMGIGCLTLYAFSSENWRRPPDEVHDLMGLLSFYLRRETAELHRQGVRVRMIGQRDKLSPDILTMIETAERVTAENGRLTLTLALSYGGRDEIARAARAVALAARAGRIDPERLDEAGFARFLETDGLPDVDLLIRTSGEKRISNFMLWQSAYAELVFVDRLWPDFGRADLEEAIREFNGRERRFGASVGATR